MVLYRENLIIAILLKNLIITGLRKAQRSRCIQIPITNAVSCVRLRQKTIFRPLRVVINTGII